METALGRRHKRLRAISGARHAALSSAGTWLEDDLLNDPILCNPETQSRILRHFPREDDGRFPLNQTVLLKPVADTPPPDRTKSPWVVATSPQRRRDPQLIKICVSSVIPENLAERWDLARWIWDQAVRMMAGEERLGVKALERGNGDPVIATACNIDLSVADKSEEDRVRICLMLLDSGRFGDAFDLYGISVDADVWRLLDGIVPHTRYEGLGDLYADTLGHALRRSAPWQLSMGFDDRKRRSGKIVTFPKQTHARKLSLLLTVPLDGPPRIHLEGTASNAVVPNIEWQRPIEMDLWRLLGT